MRLSVFRLLCLLALLFTAGARAAEPLLKKGDVVALIGGEDMVLASENGFLEQSIVSVLPDYHLRFRSLAWEGDTVFEQRRDLNFPSWEEQLDKIGATVVIAQFGKMESFGGKEKLPEFTAAYEKLIERFKGGGKRRVLLIAPNATGFILPSENPNPSVTQSLSRQNQELPAYVAVCVRLAQEKCGEQLLMSTLSVPQISSSAAGNGVHMETEAYFIWGFQIASELTRVPKKPGQLDEDPKLIPLGDLIRAKNRLWFDYWRPQNWAFLAGDRTNQPSSRDWRDPSIRWFPPEREEFIPLVEAKEKEIDALALKLAQP